MSRIGRAILGRPFLTACLISLVPTLQIVRLGSWIGPDGTRHQSLFDDAMISMSYARTLASGNGLVWFPGAPRVEGITNLGWTLVMAAVHRAGLSGDAAVVAVKVLGLATVWLAAWVGLQIATQFRGSTKGSARLCTALAVTLNIPLLFWSVQGMEVGVLSLLTLLVGWLVWRIATHGSTPTTTLALVGAIAAGITTRVDFAVVAVAVVIWAVVAARARAVAIVVPVVAAVVLATAATALFRLWYFGDPVPNTYYLKLTGTAIGTRLARGALVVLATSIAYLAPGCALIAACWKRLESAERRLVALLLAIAAGQVAYCLYVGGDFAETFLLPDRYLTPALVCVLLAACAAAFAAATDAVPAPHPWRVPVVVVVAAVIAPVVGVAILDRSGGIRTLGLDGVQLRDAAPAALATLVACAAILALASWFGAGRPGARGTAFAAGVTLCLLVAAAPQGLSGGSMDGGASSFAALGAQLATVTTPGAVIAVTGAGATQYVSDRPMIDLLGKSDRHIAKGRVATDVFVPGHTKWDDAYSIGEQRPDVVAQLAEPGGADEELRGYGYVPMRLAKGQFSTRLRFDAKPVVWVRPDSPNVRFDQLVPADG